ncbi:nudix hydrolase [Moumouvirus maliensis]|nr:nudix hydrolase [Moumouvirus maliensis]
MSSITYKTILESKPVVGSSGSIDIPITRCVTPAFTRKAQNTKLIRRCGIALLDKDDYVLIVKQNNYIGKWGFPKGHMEKEDNGIRSKCAVREFLEEVNVTVSSLNCTILQECRYRYTREKDDFEITIYVLKSEKSHTEIETNISIELSSLKWIQYSELKEQFRRNRGDFNVSVYTVVEEYVQY